jgi:hypothetical protein
MEILPLMVAVPCVVVSAGFSSSFVQPKANNAALMIRTNRENDSYCFFIFLLSFFLVPPA